MVLKLLQNGEITFHNRMIQNHINTLIIIRGKSSGFGFVWHLSILNKEFPS